MMNINKFLQFIEVLKKYQKELEEKNATVCIEGSDFECMLTLYIGTQSIDIISQCESRYQETAETFEDFLKSILPFA